MIGDLYEQDFQTMQVGSEAALTILVYPALTLRGRVSYIDQRADPQTRTAKIQVVVPNREGRLRLGMYTTLAFTTPGMDYDDKTPAEWTMCQVSFTYWRLSCQAWCPRRALVEG